MGKEDAPPPPPPRGPPKFVPKPAPGDEPKPGWKGKGKTWGKYALEKAFVLSDAVGGRLNTIAVKTGNERFWPVTGDFAEEMDKCARILRSFTEVGVATEVKPENDDGGKNSKPVKVLRKVPKEVIQNALGLVIFNCFRTGIAPFGGAGGAGVIVARLPDGSWSPPSCTSPNNYGAGLLLGLDIYDAVLVINTEEALQTFFSHKITLAGDISVVAGPVGAGAIAEVGHGQGAPIYSYVKSRGLYAGVSVMGQVFLERQEENAIMYNWPTVTGGDVLTGKVRMPREAANLMQALHEAETGQAQAQNPGGLDVAFAGDIEKLHLESGLPPPPHLIDDHAGEDDPSTTRVTHSDYSTHEASRPHSVYTGGQTPPLSDIGGSHHHAAPGPPLPPRAGARATPPKLPSRPGTGANTPLTKDYPTQHSNAPPDHQVPADGPPGYPTDHDTKSPPPPPPVPTQSQPSVDEPSQSSHGPDHDVYPEFDPNLSEKERIARHEKMIAEQEEEYTRLQHEAGIGASKAKEESADDAPPPGPPPPGYNA